MMNISTGLLYSGARRVRNGLFLALRNKATSVIMGRASIHEQLVPDNVLVPHSIQKSQLLRRMERGDRNLASPPSVRSPMEQAAHIVRALHDRGISLNWFPFRLGDQVRYRIYFTDFHHWSIHNHMVGGAYPHYATLEEAIERTAEKAEEYLAKKNGATL